MVEEKAKQISKYNDSLLSISRLNDSWIRASRFMKAGNFNGWKFELDVIWMELYPDVLTQPNSDEIREKNKTFLKKIASSKTKIDMFFNLEERHLFLREIQHLAGKAGVYIDENEEGFD